MRTDGQNPGALMPCMEEEVLATPGQTLLPDYLAQGDGDGVMTVMAILINIVEHICRLLILAAHFYQDRHPLS